VAGLASLAAFCWAHWPLFGASLQPLTSKFPITFVSPQSVTFPTTNVGNVSTRSFTIQNTGTAKLVGSVGSLTKPFSVIKGGGAFTLNPKKTLKVTVEFAPKAAGMVSGVLRIKGNDKLHGATLNLTGTGKGKAAPKGPKLTLFSLPHAQVGQPYSQLVGNTTGGTPPYAYTVETGSGFPPIGIHLDGSGTLTGTPSIAGTYTFGVTVTDLTGAESSKTATLVVDPSLTGTWEGAWAWSGPGSNGCDFDDGGSFSMTITQTGNSISGSTSAGGVQTRDGNCDLISTDSDSGTISGTVSGTAVNFSFSFTGSYATADFTGTATISNNTLTATFVRGTGGSGTFTVTEQ
jgi:hypothetical protein